MKHILVFLLFGVALAFPKEKSLHPDTGLNIMELAARHGYPFEIHDNIQTEDGYLLQLHRIPHGRNNSATPNRPVALLMHCLTCSSGLWAAYGPEKGLAFMLADLGYDVWMPNARGNMWSRKHITLDPDVDKDEFWRFSWHEIAVYDVPVSIDYILAKTGEEKLFYVGHSQGTTTFYVMAAERPEYNNKIRLAVTLAPIAYMPNLTNEFIRLLAEYVDELDVIADIIGWHEFAPNMPFFDELAAVCSDNSPLEGICENAWFLIFGQDSTQMEENMVPVFATHVPAGSSKEQFVHYGQEIISGHFRQFDFGMIRNLIHYGQITPPDYNTRAITAPVALYYAASDSFAAIVDVQRLANELPNLAKNYLVPDPSFTHVDFLLSENVVELVYNDIIDLMSKYEEVWQKERG
nr:lipase 3-like [Onthophagus taurus]